MSTKVRHFLEGVEFVPVNNDDFAINFERDPSSKWTNDVTATNIVKLPEEQYRYLKNHLNTVGVQKALHYDITIGNNAYNFISDLTSGVSIQDTEAEINIERFKSKDDLIKNIESLTFEYLYQQGIIQDSDMVEIPYVLIRPNAEEQIFNCLLMIYFVADQFAESIKSTAKLIGELVAAVTPSTVVPVGATVNTGTIIKYALLIVLELAKLVALAIALTKLAQQFIELIYPRLRKFKAMTLDRLLVKGLGHYGITYESVLKTEFKKFTILPIPIDFKDKKWWDLFSTDDDRILNRGYPTSSDTTPTLMSLIDEMENIFNLQPVIRGNILSLQPKYYQTSNPATVIPNNFNLQEEMENKFDIDCSEFWKTKIISYTNDGSDTLLFDNPKGLRVEYQSYTDDTSEFTKIRGFQRIDINFALGTIKKETAVEKQVKKACEALDAFLGTNLLSQAKKRDGVLALSQSQFNVTKMLYQTGGKQTEDYVQQLGAGALWTKYHYMDVPSQLCFRVYNEMPTPMNNEMFLGILSDDRVELETGEEIEVSSCSYIPEDTTASTTFRKKDLIFAKNIKVRKVYEE